MAELHAGAAEEVARAILDGFDKHYRLTRAICRDAKGRFERGDWVAVKDAHHARIDFYDHRVREAVSALTTRFPEMREEWWPAIKHAYVGLLYDHQQPELAETFFNSVACRLLARGYRHNQYIFWRPAVSTENIESTQPTYFSYDPHTFGAEAAVQQILLEQELRMQWENLERDVAALQRAFREAIRKPLDATPGLQIHVLSSPFYRNKAAYLVGRVKDGSEETPFAIPLLRNGSGQVYADALLARREDLAMVFSLARAYFMADMEVPSAFIHFLQGIFPGKPKAELYTSLGLHKQGKTLFYRDLFEHLKHSSDKLVVAPGVKGMVMLVFTLPSFPYVFKVIRDRFEPPKDTDRARVEERYRWVKLHDRVGRMADTLEYSDVAFPLDRFDPALLEELARNAPSVVEREGETLVIKHLYIEKRMTPLDVYLRDADERRLRHGLREYGQALRELADANIWPGDLLLKNFGVTRLGRVVFYDYDELAPLAQCNFRRLPAPRDDEDELAGEPWFHVGPRDVFPEEFPRFLFTARQYRVFREEHPDLCTPEFWVRKQEAVRDGKEEEVFPYPVTRRFAHDHVPVVARLPTAGPAGLAEVARAIFTA